MENIILNYNHRINDLQILNSIKLNQQLNAVFLVVYIRKRIDIFFFFTKLLSCIKNNSHIFQV